MIEEVRLIDADGVKLAAAFVAPVATIKGDSMLLGENTTYPPGDLEDERAVWPKRVALPGAVLRPGDHRQIVLGLVPAGAGRAWSMAGYRFDYHSRFRHWSTTVRGAMVNHDGSCN